jgi:hypothetical protein
LERQSDKVKIDIKAFRAPAGQKIRLKKWATSIKPLYRSEKHYQKLLAADVVELDGLQHLLYASNGYSVLLISGHGCRGKRRRD